MSAVSARCQVEIVRVAKGGTKMEEPVKDSWVEEEEFKASTREKQKLRQSKVYLSVVHLLAVTRSLAPTN